MPKLIPGPSGIAQIVGEIEDEHDAGPAGAGRAFGAGPPVGTAGRESEGSSGSAAGAAAREPQATTASPGAPGAAGAPGTTVGGPPPASDEVVPHGTLDRKGIVG